MVRFDKFAAVKWQDLICCGGDRRPKDRVLQHHEEAGGKGDVDPSGRVVSGTEGADLAEPIRMSQCDGVGTEGPASWK